jgi:hypothetical protein
MLDFDKLDKVIHEKGRLAKSADKKNDSRLLEIIRGKDAIFARIEANLGPKFRIVVYDHDKKQVIQAFAFSRKPRNHLAIHRDDLVSLSTLPKEGAEVEIDIRIGMAGDKEAKSLYEEGRIHSSIYTASNACSEGMTKALNDIFEEPEDIDIENI